MHNCLSFVAIQVAQLKMLAYESNTETCYQIYEGMHMHQLPYHGAI